MALGSRFPSEFLKKQIERLLKPGAVIKLYRRTDDGRFREKRYVVMHVDDNTVTCIINSEISPFVKARPALLKCQVPMPSATHAFMRHDSHIDCSRTRLFATPDVVQELIGKSDWVLGNITPELRDAIVGAIKYSETLSVAEVTLLCESLSQIE
jgi:hypothetical protein